MSATAPGARSRPRRRPSGSSSSERDAPAGLDRPAVLAQHRGERVGDRARAARARPASRSGGRRRSAPSPTDELIGRFSGRTRAPRRPPNSARACASLNARASSGRRRRRGQPEARQPHRVARHVEDRPQDVLARARRSSPRARRRSASRRAPSAPSPAAVSSIERTITPALPSSSGCARSTSGQHHSSPWRSRSSESRNGEPDGHRVHGRAVVVEQARAGSARSCACRRRSRRRPRAPSPPRPSRASATAHDEPVRPRADDDRVAHARRWRRGAGSRAGTSRRPGSPSCSSSQGCARDHVGDARPSPPRSGPVAAS